MNHTDEIAIVNRAKAGDEKAFGEIYDAYARRLYDFIYYKVHHRETAQDLAGETFLKAIRGLNGFDPERGPIGAWLYRIARNTVIDHYRKRHDLSGVEDAWDLDAGHDAEADIDTLMKLQQVREHVRRLKPEQRDLVVMRVWQEMSYAEIAAALGRSEDACKMSFSRTLRQLRESMPLSLFIAILISDLWKK